MTSLVLAGLPGSGKSTYLAALFHLLRMQAPNVAGLGLAELPQDHEYLMEVEAAWLRFEAFERTVPESPGALNVNLERNGQATELAIPDLRGEDFEHVWEFGTPRPVLAEAVQEAAGVLLFVRTNAINDTEALEPTVERIETGDTFELGDWDADSAPTQTKLCDVLSRLHLLNNAKPIALVISAWDTVDLSEDPNAWAQRRLPLLYQALEANEVQFRVFGISAQGGDVLDGKVVARMSERNPVDRVADPASRVGDDLSAPLAWLLQD